MAFPKAELTIEDRSFQLAFSTTVTEGILDEHYTEGRDSVILPGRCFQTNMNLLAGASGGPVAYGDGWVFGTNSTGMEGVPVGFISSVDDPFELEVSNVRLPGGEVRPKISLVELAQLGLVPVR